MKKRVIIPLVIGAAAVIGLARHLSGDRSSIRGPFF